MLEATLGKCYTGGKNVNIATLESDDSFGTSIALNDAGDRLAVGAFTGDGFANSVTASGEVFLYSFTDTSFRGGLL